MSLAERVAMTPIASRTLIVAPGFSPSFEGFCDAAKRDMVIRSLSFSVPAFSCSNARYSVITLVIDAG